VLSVIALVTRKHIDHGDAQRNYVMKLVLPVLRQSHNNPQTNTIFPSLADTSFCSSIIQLTLNKHTNTHTHLYTENKATRPNYDQIFFIVAVSWSLCCFLLLPVSTDNP